MARLAKNRRRSRKIRRSRKTRRIRNTRKTGGDYRDPTTQSMESVPLPSKAGVSIGGRPGIFSVEEAKEFKERVMDGDQP
jgi:hypothetical protein